MAKRSLGRRLARALRHVVAGLALLVVLVIAALQTPWARSWLRGRVEAKLTAAFDGRATLGSLDYSLLFSHVELGDVQLRDRDDQVAIRVAAIGITLDRGSIVRGAPVLDELTVTGLAIAASEDATGRSNLDRLGARLVALATPSHRRPPDAIAIRAFSLAGTATLSKTDGTVVTLSGLALRGSLAARPIAHELDVTLGPIAARLALARPGATVRTLDFAIAATTLARRGNTVALDATALVLGPVSIGRVHGRVDLAGGAQVAAVSELRVDRNLLRTLAGHDVLVADIAGELTAAGPLGALVVHAAARTRGSSATLDGTLDLSDRARPRYQLALAGHGTSDDVLLAPAQHITTSLQLAVTGGGVTAADVDATLTAELGATTIGAIALDGGSAQLRAQHGALTLAQLSAHGLGVTLGATGTLSADRTFDARITAAGEPAHVVAQLHAAGLAPPYPVPDLPRATLAVTAHGSLDGSITVALEPTTLALAGGSVAVAGQAHLVHRVVAEGEASIALHHLDVARLTRLAGRPPVLGTLDGTLALHRTLSGQGADYDITLALPRTPASNAADLLRVRPALAVHARGHASPHEATLSAAIVRAGVALGTLTARLPIDPGGLVPDRAWHVTLAMPRRPLAELAALAPADLRAQLQAPGTFELRAELDGTPAAPRGTIDATITGARHAELHATVAPGIVITTTGTLGVDAIVATLGGTVAITQPFVGRVLVRPAITLDQTLALPDRAIADVPAPAQLVTLGGTVGGRVRVTGTPAALRLDGQLGWRGYRSADGGTGALTLAIAGSPTRLTATLTDGAATVVAELTRAADRLDVRAQAHADDLALLPLLPALLPPIPGSDAGRLRWDMRGTLGLVRRDAGFALDRATIDGTLAITGASFAIPHTTRRWHDIALSIAGDPAGLRLTRLELHETDPEVADRAVHVSGLLALDRLRPTRLTLALDVHDWLLLGLTSPLFTDAPTATVELRAQVDGDLTQAIPALDVTVDALALRSPDRHDRAYQPERASVSGDIIFVDATTPAGKLPVPPPATALHGLPALDVRVHVPSPVRLNRGPLDVIATGELGVTVRPDGVVPSGVLTMRSGTLNAFAADHTLVRGRIVFSRAHPIGWLELRFARQLPDQDARALADPRRPAYLALSGEPTRPVPALSGAANATLPEVEAMYDAGRAVYAPSPGLPASSTAQVPRGDQINVLTYVSLVLPHLLVLDRMSAWSEASEPRGGYGRIRHLEADRYTAGQGDRVRAVARPTTPGRSSAELQLDHMFLHDARRALGIGVRAGDRLGGGLGLVFEWSSSVAGCAMIEALQP
ncbi:MAG: translocation/assembly module TamB domain-containing protein [Kofleriaceae bacterium]